MNKEQKMTVFYYSNHGDLNSGIINEMKVEYVSDSILTKDEYKLLKINFNNYLNEFNDDIVLIATEIKEMFKSLNENKLNIRIRHNNFLQEVNYLNGKLDSCHFEIKEWDDIVRIVSNYRGIDIQYKESKTYICNSDEVSVIYSNLGIYFEKIMELYALEEKVKNKVLVKK